MTSGEQFRLRSDPGGDSTSYLWSQYPEAGTYKGIVSFRLFDANLYEVSVTAPVVDSVQTMHFILKVTDKGKPSLTRYQRVTVTPES